MLPILMVSPSFKGVPSASVSCGSETSASVIASITTARAVAIIALFI